MTTAPVRRAWLDVPFAGKDRAKALGARWDPAARSWYAPRPGLPGLGHWERLPELLPGEDRGFGEGLFVDLIPRTSWFTNVRSAVDPADWERLRQMVYRRAGDRCEACGTRRDNAAGLYLEAHERFAYDLRTGVQQLRRLICLCTGCHAATHFGFTSLRGETAAQAALAHLQQVSGMTAAQAGRHVSEAFALWQRRSRVRWQVDLSVIQAAGIAICRGEQVSRLDVELDVPGTVHVPRLRFPAGWPGLETLADLAASLAQAAWRCPDGADMQAEAFLLAMARVAPAELAAVLRARAGVRPEPGRAARALAASYERYADELAALDALRSARPRP